MHGPRNGEFARVLGSRHVTLIGSLHRLDYKNFRGLKLPIDAHLIVAAFSVSPLAVSCCERPIVLASRSKYVCPLCYSILGAHEANAGTARAISSTDYCRRSRSPARPEASVWPVRRARCSGPLADQRFGAPLQWSPLGDHTTHLL